ncbi:MAG TPA: hypothetical protein VL358_04025 [Caulobacteraceae bacterium]|nr:hypothetical protein [Caulobacteraceae bacterium]
MSQQRAPYDDRRQLPVEGQVLRILTEAAHGLKKLLQIVRPWALGLIIYAVSAILYVIAIAIGTGTPLSKLF